MRSFLLSGVVALSAIAQRSLADYGDDSYEESEQTCFSYGIDFQSGGSFFQNASSTDPFTFVSLFEGCANDVANNLLIDPNGDEYQCTDTNLQPDDTNQLSTCPLNKNDLYTGDWSVVLISNNGDDAPIAYERDFFLTVGVPETTTVTPTVTLLATNTPIFNTTTTLISTSTITSTKIVTSPKVTKSPTRTVTPARVTTTQTKTGTVRKTAYTVVPIVVTKTKTKTCSIPRRQPTKDPKCSITPTLVTAAALTPTASATSTPSAVSNRRRRDLFRRVPIDRAQRIAERKARLAEARKDKRGLDLSVVTRTELNTDNFFTTTSMVTAPASTMVFTTDGVISTTVTETATTYKGVTTLSTITITAPTPTKTKHTHTVVTTTVSTVTRKPTVTVTITTAPAQSSVVCRAKGGKMV